VDDGHIMTNSGEIETQKDKRLRRFEEWYHFYLVFRVLSFMSCNVLKFGLEYPSILGGLPIGLW